MQDRVPVNPGRVLIKPENGSASYYATITRADNPTQEGTPLNKASLLKDATAALFGFGANAVPDDVLAAIKGLIDTTNANANTKARIVTGSYTGTGGAGSSGAVNINFDGSPKVVVIVADGSTTANDQRFALFVKPLPVGHVSKISSTPGAYSMKITWGSNFLSFYGESVAAVNQLNANNTKYYYFAVLE